MRRRLSVLALIALVLPLAAPVATMAKAPSPCTSGTGLVFFPNPVVTSGNTALTDQNDADYAALRHAADAGRIAAETGL